MDKEHCKKLTFYLNAYIIFFSYYFGTYNSIFIYLVNIFLIFNFVLVLHMLLQQCG